MWMRFLPFWDEMASRIAGGGIGRLTAISAKFEFLTNPDPMRRWMDPAQGGGALLDVAIYPITLAHALAGEPTSLDASGILTDNGVDGMIQIEMTHPNGVTSMTSGSMMSERSVLATIHGSEGRIELDEPFHHPAGFSVFRDDMPMERVDTSIEGSGYRFQVEEVHHCLEEGLSESSIRPHDDTLAVMEIIDEARRSAFAP
jgi:predicted dehydrogenase